MKFSCSLKLNHIFRRLYSTAGYANSLMVLYARPNKIGKNRVGITVSKKLGKAVVRNRTKRRLQRAGLIGLIVLLVVILAVSFGFTNIYVSHTQAEQDEEFVVVTSFYPMYIATANIVDGVEDVELKNLTSMEDFTETDIVNRNNKIVCSSS